LRNAAAALAALDALREQLPVAMQDVRRGLAEVVLPGRFQVLPGRPQVILDVAHNPESVHALAANLRACPARGKTYAVFALLADKDAGGVIEPLKNWFDAWFVAGLSGERGQSGEALAAQVGTRVPAPVSVHDDPLSAFAAAGLRAVEGDRIVAFGSFYTVAAVLNHATTSR
jgi:dihydrofolate synthase/folylpolyglutamate synthase